MIAQYKHHHRDDYRASEKLRVRDKNYIKQVNNEDFKLLIKSNNKPAQYATILRTVHLGGNKARVVFEDPLL